MNLIEHQLPGTGARLRLPAGWRTSADPEVGLLSVEDVERRFASTVTAALDADRSELPAAPASAAMGMLVAPVLLDVQASEHGVDLLLCHLAGGISATARQRQVVVPEGLLVLTFTAATSRWAEVAGLADELLDSLERAS
jgi:hypothetical protein